MYSEPLIIGFWTWCPGAGGAQLPNRGALLFGAGLRHDPAEHHRRAGQHEVTWNTWKQGHAGNLKEKPGTMNCGNRTLATRYCQEGNQWMSFPIFLINLSTESYEKKPPHIFLGSWSFWDRSIANCLQTWCLFLTSQHLPTLPCTF